MKQQVNFYPAIPKYVVIKLPARVILKICIVLLIGGLGFSAYGFLQNKYLHNEFRDTKARQKVMSQKIAQLTEQYAKNPEILLLTKKIASLKSHLEVKSYILEILSHPASFGFSKYLNVLAQRIVPNVWLTKIAILHAADANTITLTGNAYRLEDITFFMQQLENDPVLAGRNFKLSHLSRVAGVPLENADQPDETQILNFTITIVEEEGKSHE